MPRKASTKQEVIVLDDDDDDGDYSFHDMAEADSDGSFELEETSKRRKQAATGSSSTKKNPKRSSMTSKSKAVSTGEQSKAASTTTKSKKNSPSKSPLPTKKKLSFSKTNKHSETKENTSGDYELVIPQALLNQLSSSSTPNPNAETTLLVQLDPLQDTHTAKNKGKKGSANAAATLDLYGNTGAIGRIETTADHSLILDLKGHLYKGRLLPGPTAFCLVPPRTQQQTPLDSADGKQKKPVYKIDAWTDEFCRASAAGNALEQVLSGTTITKDHNTLEQQTHKTRVFRGQHDDEIHSDTTDELDERASKALDDEFQEKTKQKQSSTKSTAKSTTRKRSGGTTTNHYTASKAKRQRKT